MKISNITPESIPLVATLMSTIKPEWWDYGGAVGQLSKIGESIQTVGWYMGEDENHPKGWILCRELLGYQTLELECCGYDDHGTFCLEHKLGELIEKAEEYAREKGYQTFRSGISSVGFNIHDQPIEDIGDAIHTLRSERVDYKWYIENGFRVIGIQPNVYGKGFHFILLGKDL